MIVITTVGLRRGPMAAATSPKLWGLTASSICSHSVAPRASSLVGHPSLSSSARFSPSSSATTWAVMAPRAMA
jgi:hypothetical protein